MLVHIFISGFVQGVGFRQFIQRIAQDLGLTGWVRNIPDNRVEAVFAGPKENIEKIISVCKKGPFLSEVRDVEVLWNEGSEERTYKTFEIT